MEASEILCNSAMQLTHCSNEPTGGLFIDRSQDDRIERGCFEIGMDVGPHIYLYSLNRTIVLDYS